MSHGDLVSLSLLILYKLNNGGTKEKYKVRFKKATNLTNVSL
jgi:hypothetical protein